MTKGFREHCENAEFAHPSYKSGYNPRHFNYLKSSQKLTNGPLENGILPSYPQ